MYFFLDFKSISFLSGIVFLLFNKKNPQKQQRKLIIQENSIVQVAKHHQKIKISKPRWQ